MVSLGFIRELFDYNYWAQDRQLAACSLATPSQFSLPLAGSFSSLRDTFAHLVDGEEYALHRWQGESREQIIAAMGSSSVDGCSKFWPARFPTFETLRLKANEVDGEVRRFVAGLTELRIASSVSYVDSGRRTWTYPLWRLLVHQVTHQTYHRGQVTILFRQLGLTPARIDFLDVYDLGRDDV